MNRTDKRLLITLLIFAIGLTVAVSLSGCDKSDDQDCQPQSDSTHYYGPRI